MLLTLGEARDFRHDRWLAGSFATIAGVVNAAGFRAFGLFSANMTGNMSAASVHVAQGKFWAAAFFVTIVLAFIVGAAAAALLLETGYRHRVRSIHALGILSEAAFLFLLGGAVQLLPELDRATLLIPGLSLLMGLQNAVVTRISDGRVRTTHISGMATDLGIELGLLARGELRGEALAVCRAKLRLHTQTIVAFAAGGVLGVWLYDLIGLLLLPCAAVALAALALPGVRRATVS